MRGKGIDSSASNIFSIYLNEELNQKVNNNKNNSSNSLIFGRWLQTKTCPNHPVRSSYCSISWSQAPFRYGLIDIFKPLLPTFLQPVVLFIITGNIDNFLHLKIYRKGLNQTWDTKMPTTALPPSPSHVLYVQDLECELYAKLHWQNNLCHCEAPQKRRRDPFLVLTQF